MNEVKKERLIELLADKTVFGLNEEESNELHLLKKDFPELENDTSFELSAAAINLAGLDTAQELPVNLRSRILADAENFFDSVEEQQNAEKFNGETGRNVNAANVELGTKRPFWQWLGWAVAGAACIALAVNLWTTRFQSTPEIVKTPPSIQTPTPELNAAQQREQLLAKTKDIIQTTWTEANPKQAKNISGDVVWSDSEQKGYMRFRGLPVNNPDKETYQLWIFDEAQDPKTPVSGGVFDVNENGEVVVPIDAEIKVKKPKMFAVTKEKPGGVVVSKQEEIMAIAKV